MSAAKSQAEYYKMKQSWDSGSTNAFLLLPDLLSSKDTQVCSALHPYNTCQCTSKIHLLSRGLLSLPPRVSVPLCIYVFKNGNMELKCFSVLPLPFFFLFAKPFFSSHSSYLWQSMLKQSAPCHILGGKWHWYCTKCKKRLSPCENCLIDVKANNFKELWWLQIGSERAVPVHSTSHRGCALQFKQQHFGIQSFFITQTNQISNLCDLDAWQ